MLVLLQKKNCDNYISFSAVLVIIADKLKEQVVKISKNDLTGNLTLQAPNKNCSRWHFNFLLLSLEENKA